jgi:hypothetical protein
MSSYGRYIDEMAALVGLAVAQARKPGVEQSLAVMLRMAGVPAKLPFDDAADEHATVLQAAGSRTTRTDL